MNIDEKSAKEEGDKLFSQKAALDQRNQEIANHFYPERATFTKAMTPGQDFAGHLMTGYPSLVRRDLGNSFGAMLRPRAKQWFYVGIDGDEGEEFSGEAVEWMQRASGTQRRAMYDRVTQFTRATKAGDHDFAAFGGAGLQVEVNWRTTSLLYRCWHLRDLAWRDDTGGEKVGIHRAWKPEVRELVKQYGKDALHPTIADICDKEPLRAVPCRHVVISADEYDSAKKVGGNYISLHIDIENNHVMKSEPLASKGYVIPVWATIPDSQYPYSPATLIALPDARLLQAMTLTILEAGEKYVNPPMIGVGDAIRGNVEMFAGGFTSVDMDYDERLGEVLRPITQDRSGLPYGFEMSDRIAAMMKEAFYLNSLELPPHGGPDMTAYEVGQRVQEYIRRALPLFEPMEYDYNGQLCEETFDLLMANGAFGPLDQIPEDIAGRDIRFKFESPLADMIEREKGQKFLEAKAILASALDVDPSMAALMDFGETLRDVLRGIGVPESWMRSEDEVKREQERMAAAQQQDQVMAQLQAGADVASKLGVDAGTFGTAA